MTKMQILQKISKVDDRMLEFYDKKPKINPMKLKKAELERLLDAFITIDELFTKCSDVKELKNDMKGER